MNQGLKGLIEKNDKSHILVGSNLSVDLSKKLDVNGGRVSPIPNGVSKTWNPVFGTSNKFSSVSVPGSRIVSWIKNCFSLPTPLKVIDDDDAKKTNRSLSEEVLQLRSQVEDLNRKAQLQQVELEQARKELQVAIRMAAAGKESAERQAAKEVIKSLTAQHTQRASEATRGPKAESGNGDGWVEQDEPGVYIKFTSLPGGIKYPKRIRFSRKRFTEKQARQWWAVNGSRVYQQCWSRVYQLTDMSCPRR